MDFLEFNAGIDDNDRRIDKVLRNFIKDVPLSSIYKYIRKNLIKINNKKTTQDYRVKTGDVISIAAFIINDFSENQSESNNLQKNEETTLKKDLEIIFQNEDILILNKPYDVLVHGSDNSLDKQVENYYKKINQNKSKSLSFTPGPLHRLDRKTTGLLSFSLSLNGARWFSENIKNHTIQKKYVSVVQNKLLHQEEWIDYIEKKSDKDNSKFHKVEVSKLKENDEQKKCITKITPVKYGKYKNKDITFVEIEIKTGRMHQIRAQAALHNHPLLGDTAYGGLKLEDFSQDFFLHAKELIFPSENPINLPKTVNATLPQPFLEFTDKFFD
jgi:23S rRNA pseudouridine955/2504/2580 synthase